MPSPGAPAPPRLPIEDSYFELLADTLEGLDLPARGQFLQRYLRAIAHLELREDQSVQIWDDMLSRRRELTNLVGRPVSVKTALTDVLCSSGFLRLPILIEYEELKRLELDAVTDPLTGLHNRRLFSESFEKELNRARRYGQPLGLDLGVAIFPQDAEHADQLIRIADERLYQIKHANHSRPGNGSTRTATPAVPETPAAPAPEQASSAPQPISIETRRAPEKAETSITAAP